MSPDDRALIQDLTKRVNQLENCTSVGFVENIKRFALEEAVSSDATSGTGGTTVSVRNAADTGAQTVAKEYDKTVRLYLLNGQSILVGGYN